jgi:hypothetical protein
MVTDDHYSRAAKQALQNPVHSGAVTGLQGPSQEKESAVQPAFLGCTADEIPPRGTERPQDSGRKTEYPPAPGTESGTPPADPLPELLALVVELPPDAAALLLTIARRLRPRPA